VILVNGDAVDGDGRSVAETLDALGIISRGVAVAVNGEVVRRGDWHVTSLRDGDVVEIVTAVAGG
jgi:sulfur carrier protein